jgi:hypothetical protein
MIWTALRSLLYGFFRPARFFGGDPAQKKMGLSCIVLADCFLFGKDSDAIISFFPAERSALAGLPRCDYGYKRVRLYEGI